MRLVVILLSLTTVKNVASEGFKPVKFHPKVLLPDLQAISNYFENIDNSLQAYIHWPKAITYRVKSIEENSERYLKIDGTFLSAKFKLTSTSYDSLYYKDKKFYVNVESGRPITEISPDHSLHYMKQPDITLGTSYISIRYFRRKDIKKRAKSKYEHNRSYYEWALPTQPATFFLSLPGYNHFVEYSFWSSIGLQRIPAVDGGLRVLVGNKLMGQRQRKIDKSMTTSKLLIDPKSFSVTIPDDVKDGSLDRASIFGVRMGDVGFLAEHRGSNVRMLSRDDISSKSGKPDRHIVLVVDLLSKLWNVQPTLSDSSHWLNSMPRFGKFQLRGHILEKSLNYNADNKVNPDCPYVIAFNIIGPYFLLGTNKVPVKEVCTDDYKVWPKGEPYPTNINIISLTLVHPDA